MPAGWLCGVDAGLAPLQYALAFWFGSKLIADGRTKAMDSLRNAGCVVENNDVAFVCNDGYMAGTNLEATCDAICTGELIPCLLGETCKTGGNIVRQVDVFM